MVNKKLNLTQMRRHAEKVSRIMKCMGNEQRLLILCRLAEGEKSVGELVELTGLSQSALSQHLGVLRNNDIVDTRREAQSIYYSMISADVLKIIELLYSLYCK